MKKILIAALCAMTLAGCDNQATVVNQNMKVEADNFGIARRIVFLNTRTDKYELLIEGFCSIDKGDTLPDEVVILCKTPSGYQKHFNFIGGDLRMFVQQLDTTTVSAKHYKLTFAPSQVIPSIDIH